MFSSRLTTGFFQELDRLAFHILNVIDGSRVVGQKRQEDSNVCFMRELRVA